MSQKDFLIGQRVRLISVHHPIFEKKIGSILIVKRFAGESFWCSPDELRPRRKRNGEIEMVLPNWMTLYSRDQLEPAFIADHPALSGKM